jgi:hypothetical protein
LTEEYGVRSASYRSAGLSSLLGEAEVDNA